MSLSDELREVYGLTSFADMFGYKLWCGQWHDTTQDDDWTWHDVMVALADRIDAENKQLRQFGKDALVALACEFAEETHAWPDESWGWWDKAESAGIEVE